MKICGKKLIAGAAALAMACSMTAAFADETTTATGNTVSITKVEILNNGETAATEANTFTDLTTANISLTTEQLMRVTAELKNSTPANVAGEISFLSNVKGDDGTEVTLDNRTIQYVDQQTYDGTTAVTITFRPRTTIGTGGTGTFIAKAGGTDVTSAATFDYTVVAPKKNMTVDQNSKEITQGTESVSFTLVPGSSLAIKNVKVTENNTDISGCTFDENNNTLTISTATLTVGTHTFVISADGYNPISVTVNVTAKQQEIKDEDKPGVSTGIENALKPTPKQDEDKSFAFDEKVTVNSTDYTIEYSVPTEESDKVTINGNKLTLKDGVFAAKVQLTAKVGDVRKTKPVYLIPNDVTVSYGNLELISNADGSDAFDPSKVTTQEAFMNVVNSNANSILAARTEALNIALKEGAYEKNPIALDAIDFDYDNKVVLAEYRIFKLMLENDSIHTFAAVNAKRAEYTKHSGN